jgi:RNA polymerase sigma-70 factor (ECF subfamily)
LAPSYPSDPVIPVRSVRGTQAVLPLTSDRGGTASAEVTDADLLKRLRTSDRGALDTLLERHWAVVYRYALRRTGSHDAASDVAQDVFCRVWERRATWRGDGSVRGLLFRLTRNATVSRFRRQRARQRAMQGFIALHVDDGPDSSPAERAELRGALRRAIADLPSRRREVFLLRMIEGLSYEEIAGAMGTSRQTVANQLSHALATLRRSLATLVDSR